jgi:hypothetical protein
MDTSSAAQLAFVLGGFLGQDVALERLTAFDAATSANDEAFLRAALGLHLWHDYSLSYETRCFPVEKLATPAPLFIGDDFHCFGIPAVPLRRNATNSFFLGFG